MESVQDYKLRHVTNYFNWTLEEIWESDKAYLYYIFHTHKTPLKLKSIIYKFLKLKEGS